MTDAGQKSADEDPSQKKNIEKKDNFSIINWVKNLFRKPVSVKQLPVHSKELEAWLNEAKMTKAEREMCYNLLVIRELTVEDIMIPRVDIVALPFKSTFTDILHHFQETRHSALLVYLADLDDILGIIHLKEVIDLALNPANKSLKPYIRKVHFVSPSLPALDLLYRMRSTGIHYAVVVDEYGGTDGLVSIDEIIERIVGDIEDETEIGEDPELRGLEDGSYIADARVFLDDLEETLGCRFSDDEHEESDTLGGLIFDLIGRIPVRGEVISHAQGLEFHVLDADPRRIKKIQIYIKKQDD
ncbi:MAG: hemolysin family protein [Alphaproteobacteria bacterium]|nr:hemolysin family protein [Alphaproteobacteria bacterium]